jgi:hypothetical protein
MGNSIHSPGDYWIEISGWGLDSGFFVERTDLLWSGTGEKRVRLHRALAEGAVVFIRLLTAEHSNHSVPVPYQVESVEPMDCNGRCEARLKQLHRRTKESLLEKTASNEVEDLPKECDGMEDGFKLQHEEILR